MRGSTSNRGAKRTEYNGRTYASKSEANYAKHLDALLAAGKIMEWEAQPRWPLVVNGFKVCTIVPDFFVVDNTASGHLVEVKGFETPVWKLKVKLFKALHPGMDYRVVKAREALAL